MTPSVVVLFEMSTEVRTYASGSVPGAAFVAPVVSEAAGEALGVEPARLVAGVLVVRLRDVGDVVGHGQVVDQVRQVAVEDPERAVDAAAVEDLDEDFRVARVVGQRGQREVAERVRLRQRDAGAGGVAVVLVRGDHRDGEAVRLVQHQVGALPAARRGVAAHVGHLDRVARAGGGCGGLGRRVLPPRATRTTWLRVVAGSAALAAAGAMPAARVATRARRESFMSRFSLGLGPRFNLRRCGL